MELIGLIVLLLICLSAFFSGSETGLTAVSRARIHQLKNAGNPRAKKVSQLLKQKEHLIGAILLGNNAVNILASALATSVLIGMFGSDGVVYATIGMTLLVLVFAEVLPKSYAIHHAEKVALLVAPIFVVLVKILAPITLAVQWVVNAVLRMFGVRLGEGVEVQDTFALRGSIDMHHDAGVVVKDDRDMLDGVLDLSDVEVEKVMIHRSSMESVDIDQPMEEIINQVLASNHSRLPFWKGEADNIVGVLHVKHLLHALYKKQPLKTSDDLVALMSEPWFVPQKTSLNGQLAAFRERQSHFALVVDEYGSLLGLVTLEDILEEIVGQIEDELDDSRQAIKQNKDGTVLVEGAVSVRDLNRELDWNLPDDDVSTVAGLLIHEVEQIPNVGQVFNFHGVRFEVVRKKKNQIALLRLSKMKR